MSDQDSKPVSQNRVKKNAVVADLSETIGKAKGLVFTNYQGLTHKQIESLKVAIKPLDANFEITKNTLLKIALEQKNLKIEDEKGFDGPTGTLFLFGDVIEPLKKLAKTIKDFNLPKIKFAIIDGKSISAEDVIKLSALPSRETLLTQLAFSLKSPIIGLHRALNWNLQKLVMTLNAVAMSKPAIAAAPTAPVAEPVAEAATKAVVEPAAQEAEEAVAESENTEEVKSEGGEN